MLEGTEAVIMGWFGCGRRAAVASLGLLAFVVLTMFPPPMSAAATTSWVDPARMSSIVGSDQLVMVTAANLSTTYGWLTEWDRRAGRWVKVGGPYPVRLGYAGLSNLAIGQRRQNDGSTPTGSYSLGLTFGTSTTPSTRMHWRHVDSNDYWVDDPRDPVTYNTYQVARARTAHWRLSQAERLITFGRQYEFAAVVNFNVPSGVHYANGQYVTSTPANVRLGGGIFLHVDGPGATAGCISMSRTPMRKLIHWLDPAKHPRVVIGTPAILRTL
jgi:L,D-peptidoglycan transpeptidase YkuD (ErfK/YbiS/YcfS/YnhG family)